MESHFISNLLWFTVAKTKLNFAGGLILPIDTVTPHRGQMANDLWCSFPARSTLTWTPEVRSTCQVRFRYTGQHDKMILLRPQAASGAEQTAVGCIGLTWGMLPRLARHSFFGLFWSANGWREMMEEQAVRWCQKVKRMSGSDDLKDL